LDPFYSSSEETSFDSTDGNPAERGSRSSSSSTRVLDHILFGSERDEEEDPSGPGDAGSNEAVEGQDGAALDHASGGASEPPRAARPARRPCKSKRLRYQALAGRLEKQIEADPTGFDFGSLELPPSVEANERLKSKLSVRMQKYRAGVLERQDGGAASATALADVSADVSADISADASVPASAPASAAASVADSVTESVPKKQLT